MSRDSLRGPPPIPLEPQAARAASLACRLPFNQFVILTSAVIPRDAEGATSLRGVIDKKRGRYNAAISDLNVLRPDITSGSELNPLPPLLPSYTATKWPHQETSRWCRPPCPIKCSAILLNVSGIRKFGSRGQSMCHCSTGPDKGRNSKTPPIRLFLISLSRNCVRGGSFCAPQQPSSFLSFFLPKKKKKSPFSLSPLFPFRKCRSFAFCFRHFPPFLSSQY